MNEGRKLAYTWEPLVPGGTSIETVISSLESAWEKEKASRGHGGRQDAVAAGAAEGGATEPREEEETSLV